MVDINIREVVKENLVDIQDIEINEALAKNERMKEFLEQVKNPYCYKVDDVVVSVSFSNNGVTFEERLKQFLDTL
ncbi:MAG: DUF6870 family protein [Lachnospirales bacterium]